MRLPLMRTADLPFVVRRRAMGWTARRALRAMVEATGGEALRGAKGFEARTLAEDEALLVELRLRVRRACPTVRLAAEFAASIEGRRVHRLIDTLSERIAERQESVLCG